MRSSETNHRDPTLVTRETEERHTEERRGPWDERGRNWSHVAISQVIRQLLELEEARKASSLEAQREHSPPNTLISDVWLQNPEK